MKQDAKKTSQSFKVKVLKSSGSAYWYAGRIGEVFVVEQSLYFPDNYQVIDNTFRLLLKKDCEIVEEPGVITVEVIEAGFGNWYKVGQIVQVIKPNQQDTGSFYSHASDPNKSLWRHHCKVVTKENSKVKPEATVTAVPFPQHSCGVTFEKIQTEAFKPKAEFLGNFLANLSEPVRVEFYKKTGEVRVLTGVVTESSADRLTMYEFGVGYRTVKKGMICKVSGKNFTFSLTKV